MRPWPQRSWHLLRQTAAKRSEAIARSVSVAVGSSAVAMALPWLEVPAKQRNRVFGYKGTVSPIQSRWAEGLQHLAHSELESSRKIGLDSEELVLLIPPRSAVVQDSRWN